jgi:hypothetical protein
MIRNLAAQNSKQRNACPRALIYTVTADDLSIEEIYLMERNSIMTQMQSAASHGDGTKHIV